MSKEIKSIYHTGCNFDVKNKTSSLFGHENYHQIKIFKKKQHIKKLKIEIADSYEKNMHKNINKSAFENIQL